MPHPAVTDICSSKIHLRFVHLETHVHIMLGKQLCTHGIKWYRDIKRMPCSSSIMLSGSLSLSSYSSNCCQSLSNLDAEARYCQHTLPTQIRASPTVFTAAIRRMLFKISLAAWNADVQ